MGDKALIVGVGPEAGLGAALCRRFASLGLEVFAAGRTLESLEACVGTIVSRGGRATAVVADASREADVVRLFDTVERTGNGILDLVVYNAGNMVLGMVHEMEASVFEQAWRVGCLGGVLVGREALRRMLPRGRGTILFTGATASLRGRPQTAAFAVAKFGLRALAQSMARAYGPKGIHVAHVVVDGGIAGDKVLRGAPGLAAAKGAEGLIDLEGLAEVYAFLYAQPRTAWTHELDLRTFKEPF